METNICQRCSTKIARDKELCELCSSDVRQEDYHKGKKVAEYTMVITGIMEFVWSSDISRWYILEDSKGAGIWVNLPDTATLEELVEAWRTYKPQTKEVTIHVA